MELGFDSCDCLFADAWDRFDGCQVSCGFLDAALLTVASQLRLVKDFVVHVVSFGAVRL